MVNFTEIIQTIKSLVETRIELVKSDIQDQLVGILSRLILLVLIGSIGLVSGLFLSLSLAFYISQVTQSPYLGFLVVALCYLVVVVFLYFTKDSIGFQQQFNAFLKKSIFKDSINSSGESNFSFCHS